MANQEQLAILARGVSAWNEWKRKRGGAIPIDLSAVDLHAAEFAGADLVRANLRDTNLIEANLHKANLAGADLRRANLTGTNLSGACLVEAKLGGAELEVTNLSGANLSNAKLAGAKFMQVNLSGANLREANLRGADFVQVNVKDADFSGAVAGQTSFGDVDLRDAKGLETVTHGGPSHVSIDTIYRSGGKIPEGFLRGAGVPDDFTTYLKSLTGRAIEFYSCFISYSTKDQEFAERLYADLQANHVRCWYAPNDIQGGKKIHEQIDQAIRLQDKLLLILSKDSIASGWVKTEIKTARKRGRAEGRQVLFPIGLVDLKTISDWKLFDADTGEDVAEEVREYFIPDFSKWENHDSYQKAFQKLLRDLQAGKS